VTAAIGAPTLICGFPKSGTTLLMSLLDGHPDLLCFPEETWALKVASSFPRAEWLSHVLGSDALRRMGAGAVESPGGARDYTGFDHGRFETGARTRWAAADGSPRALLESVMGAYAEALATRSAVRWVEKSPEHELELARHAADWRDLRVVHVVRDPRAVLCSFRRKREIAGQRIYVDGLARRWREGLAAVLAQEERLPGSVAIVRYEDVVADLRATLGHVLAALDVPWHDAVLHPTVFGRPWAGNSMYRSAMHGISAASLDRWSEEIDPRERAVLEACLARELEALDYVGVATGARFVRDALPLVLRERAGWRARGRALRRLVALRDSPPAPVGSPAFARAYRPCRPRADPAG